MDLLKWITYHTPSDLILVQNRRFLWEAEHYQFVIVFEDRKLKIYSYVWDSDDEVIDDWRFCGDVFENFSGTYREDSLGYIEVPFTTLEETEKRIFEACERQLDSFANYTREDTHRCLLRREKKLDNYVWVYDYYK